MSSFRPRSGQVVNFGYLWSWEAEAGHDRARYRRPCLIVQVDAADCGKRLRMVPISHRPVSRQPSIEIPKAYLREGGLDGHGCFVVPSDVNTVAWPSGAWDRQLFEMGQLPSGFLRTVQGAILELHKTSKLNVLDREELAREIVEAYRDRDR